MTRLTKKLLNERYPDFEITGTYSRPYTSYSVRHKPSGKVSVCIWGTLAGIEEEIKWCLDRPDDHTNPLNNTSTFREVCECGETKDYNNICRDCVLTDAQRAMLDDITKRMHELMTALDYNEKLAEANLQAVKKCPRGWGWAAWLNELKVKVEQMEWKLERKRARECDD